jgi:hypothetical protein
MEMPRLSWNTSLPTTKSLTVSTLVLAQCVVEHDGVTAGARPRWNCSAFALLRPAGGAGVFASLFAMLFEPGTWVSSGYLTNK